MFTTPVPSLIGRLFITDAEWDFISGRVIPMMVVEDSPLPAHAPRQVSIPESEMSMSVVNSVTEPTSSTRQPGGSIRRRTFLSLLPWRQPHDHPTVLSQHSQSSSSRPGSRYEPLPAADSSPRPSSTPEPRPVGPCCCTTGLLGPVNAEPAIFLFAVSFGVLLSALPLLIFWLRCVQTFGAYSDLANATEYCARISLMNTTDSLDRVERDVAQLSIYMQVLSSAGTLVSAPLLGAWSDYNGRRSPFLLAIVGLTLYCSVVTLGIQLYTRASIFLFMLMAELLGALFGISSVLNLATTIVADDCREQLGRPASGVPVRMGIACAMLAVGVVLGSAINEFFSVPLKEGGGGVGNEGHVDGYWRTMLVSF